MNRALRVLIVEDSENDAVLLGIELQRVGYQPLCRRVENAEAMRSALANEEWDLVIADYVLPCFSGLDALKLVEEKKLDLPFIIVSGHITDSAAVAAMKAGAHDYVMKDNLARLGPAVQRELREAEERRARRGVEEKLHREQTFREAIENSVPSGIAAVDLEGRQTYVNPAFCEMVGWGEAELVGARPPFVYWPPEDIHTLSEALGKVVQGHAPAGGLELRFQRRNGERFHVLYQITPLRDSFGNISGWVSSASDITTRKRAEVRLAAEHAITRRLAAADSLEVATPDIVQDLLEGLDAEIGGMWVLSPEGTTLRLLFQKARAATPPLELFCAEARRLTIYQGVALPGRAWQQRRAVWISDLAQEGGLLRREAAVKAGLASAMAFPIQNGEEFFGVLEMFTARRAEPDPTTLNMMSAIGSEIGQFIQRRKAEEALRRAHDELETRVQQRTADLKRANSQLETAITERERLERELLEITEKERRRIGLDLHDDLGQKLSGIAMMTKGLELRLKKHHAPEALEAEKIRDLVQQAMSHARSVARDLTTLDFKEKALPEALRELAGHAQDTFAISCQFKAAGEIAPLKPNVVSQLYKIAQEAVTNAVKHGKAKHVGISLANGAGRVVLTIDNTGLPFPEFESKSAGMGLRIMNYRANLIGASLEVKGVKPEGTRVTCSLPLEGKK
jgi:PAS domain S-box-containing protein